MDHQQQAAQDWAEALSDPTEQRKAALAELLAEDAVSVSPMGMAQGKADILAGFGQSPIGELFAQAKWSEPTSEGRSADMTSTFPASAPIGGITLHLVFDGDDRISRIETGMIAAAPPQATDIAITQAMRLAVNGALLNRTPITVAYVDRMGQPHLSLRGTTQVFSDDQLAIWIRNAEGGLLSAIESNPRLTLLYRDPATRTTFQFYGRGRIDLSEETADRVYSNSPEAERNLDPQRRGMAVIIDLERVEGRDATGAILMERTPNGN